MKKNTKEDCRGVNDITISGTLASEEKLKERIAETKKDKTIGFYTVIAVTMYLELYWTLKEYIQTMLNNIPWLNDVFSTIIFYAIGLFSASAGYYIIYYLVRKYHLKKWAKKNARMWVCGNWLHIHIKDVVRIGYLHIDQDFDRLNVYGYNTDPNLTKPTITTWKYEVGRVIRNSSRASISSRPSGPYLPHRSPIF